MNTKNLITEQIRSQGVFLTGSEFPGIAEGKIIVAVSNLSIHPTNEGPVPFVQVENEMMWDGVKGLALLPRIAIDLYELPIEAARRLGVNSRELRDARYRKQLALA